MEKAAQLLVMLPQNNHEPIDQLRNANASMRNWKSAVPDGRSALTSKKTSSCKHGPAQLQPERAAPSDLYFEHGGLNSSARGAALLRHLPLACGAASRTTPANVGCLGVSLEDLEARARPTWTPWDRQYLDAEAEFVLQERIASKMHLCHEAHQLGRQSVKMQIQPNTSIYWGL